MNKHSNAAFPAFGQRVRDARKKAGFSQQALADLVHVSRNTVVNWESGRCVTDAETALALCRVLNLTPDELMLPADIQSASTADDRTRIYNPLADGSEIAIQSWRQPAKGLSGGEQRMLQLYRALSNGGRRRAESLLQDLLRNEQAGPAEAESAECHEGRASGGKDRSFRLFAEYPSTSPVPNAEFCDTRPKPVILHTNARNRQANAVVRVSGDSMEPAYHDGDLLYFRYANSARTGTDVVCSTIHGTIVKRMGEDGLFSVNPLRPYEMKTAADNVRLLGIVTGIAEPGDWPAPEEENELAQRFQAEEADFRRKYRLEDWE